MVLKQTCFIQSKHHHLLYVVMQGALIHAMAEQYTRQPADIAKACIRSI